MRNKQPPPEYDAVRHILTSRSVEARSAPYIGDDDFDWDGLLAEAETMSGGEQALVRIAHDLWEAKGIVGIWEIPRAPRLPPLRARDRRLLHLPRRAGGREVAALAGRGLNRKTTSTGSTRSPQVETATETRARKGET